MQQRLHTPRKQSGPVSATRVSVLPLVFRSADLHAATWSGARPPYHHTSANAHIHTCLNESEQVPTTLAAASLDALRTHNTQHQWPQLLSISSSLQRPVCTHKHLRTRAACKESERVPATQAAVSVHTYTHAQPAKSPRESRLLKLRSVYTHTHTRSLQRVRESPGYSSCGQCAHIQTCTACKESERDPATRAAVIVHT